MVIDDDGAERLLLQEITVDLAVEWVMCSGGADAWTYLDTHPLQLPQVILVDLNLTGEQGLDWVRRVRASPAFSALVILVRSGAMRDEQVREAYQAGASGVLMKPQGLLELEVQMAALVAFYRHGAFRFSPIR
ncbi:response regulator [Deinococcus kurensis]|uniref:response regulator n=1 Tax=Deinococcus kurensis TaxID=2662757 RepID=UPI0012D2F777|nr:response regulator [Deinococcus kurensis]